MRKKILFIIIIIITAYLSVNGQRRRTQGYQEFSIEKQGIEFPDGKKQRDAVLSAITSVPDIGYYRIYATTSPGIQGDVLDPNYTNAIQFYQIENLLSSQFQEDEVGPYPIGDPINNYFEAIKLPDRASVDLINSFQGGDIFQEIRFDIVNTNSGPSPIVLYRIIIEGVGIARIELKIENVPDGSNSKIIFYEKYTFMFDEMRIEFPADGNEYVSFLIYGNDN